MQLGTHLFKTLSYYTTRILKSKEFLLTFLKKHIKIILLSKNIKTSKRKSKIKVTKRENWSKAESQFKKTYLKN